MDRGTTGISNGDGAFSNGYGAFSDGKRFLSDRECAFCGRADSASQQVFCDDCHTVHGVCRACATEARAVEAA
jgi:hypothetical protein